MNSPPSQIHLYTYCAAALNKSDRALSQGLQIAARSKITLIDIFEIHKHTLGYMLRKGKNKKKNLEV